MITTLEVNNFKSVGSAEFRLTNLNLFSGPNSSGKSSVIQAILLGADNISENTGVTKNMTSTHIKAISFNESRNYITNAKQYDVRLGNESGSVVLEFKPKDEAFINTVVEQGGTLPENDIKLIRNLFHLSAIRSGDLGAPRINPDPDSSPLGPNGEYLIDFYYMRRKDLLDASLIYYKEIRTLEGQLNYWLKQLTGYLLTVEPLGSEYKVRYITPEGKSIHPYNVGTGVNFVTQTLIVCLASQIGSSVIIENPEIHLHPAAQARVLDFFVGVANAGIQVIIESHSDHFFNGIRRSLKQKSITPEQVSVYNFKKNNGLTEAQEIKLSPYGGIENYEPGMFDQFDADLDAILS